MTKKTLNSKYYFLSLTLYFFSFANIASAEQVTGHVKSYIGDGTNGINSFEELLLAILQVLITISIPIIVLFIIYSGFLYVTARGNVEQTQKATRSLTYSIIGGVIIIGAVALSVVLKNLISSFTA